MGYEIPDTPNPTNLQCDFINLDLHRHSLMDEHDDGFASERARAVIKLRTESKYDIGDNCGLQSMFPSYQTIKAEQIRQP